MYSMVLPTKENEFLGGQDYSFFSEKEAAGQNSLVIVLDDSVPYWQSKYLVTSQPYRRGRQYKNRMCDAKRQNQLT